MGEQLQTIPFVNCGMDMSLKDSQKNRSCKTSRENTQDWEYETADRNRYLPKMMDQHITYDQQSKDKIHKAHINTQNSY